MFLEGYFLDIADKRGGYKDIKCLFFIMGIE